MKHSESLPFALGLALSTASIGLGADPTEPFLAKPPPGVVVETSAEAPASQAKAIGQKLGGVVERLTNSKVRVQGRPIQVNALTAVDESSARAIHAGLLKIKPSPFCLRNGKVVIEYVGTGIDAALAVKTSYELGLQPKPASVRYRVTADLATVEKADYMACTPLFNRFLAAQSGSPPQAIQGIAELAKRFQFGRSLALRNPSLDHNSATHQFEPAATGSKASAASIDYTFGELPSRHGVPYVTATIETTVDGTGFRRSAASPPESSTAATAFWPTDDPAILTLARKLTEGRATADARVSAILEWLAPGQHLRYAGEMGSRWGVAKVLEQKFGRCWDFSDCFVTLARAAGVPSRQVAGWLYGSDGHVWAEYYRDGKGWQQVDPTGGGMLECGIYHIPFFTSEDGEMPIVYLSMPKIETVGTK